MRQPNPQCLPVIDRYSERSLFTGSDSVKQITVLPRAGHAKEVSGHESSLVTLAIRSSHAHAQRNSPQRGPGCGHDTAGDSEIMRQNIRRSKRNHRQRGAGSDQSLREILNRAVTATSKDRVATLSYCVPGL